MSEDYGVGVNEWVSVVRRARLDRTTKLVALTLATYADPDGTHVFPGLARLTVQCRIDYRTARRALRKLRDVGLVEVVRRGNRRRGMSDEYRVILHADLFERVEVPSPDEERAEIEAVATERAAEYRERHHGGRIHRHVTDESLKARDTLANPASDDQLHRSRLTRDSRITGQETHGSQGTGDPPPSIRPLPIPTSVGDDPPSVPSDDGSPTGTPAGARESGDSQTAQRDLDLAMNGSKTNSHTRTPWRDLDEAWKAGHVSDEELEEQLLELLGGVDGYELSTIGGMIASGTKPIVIYNTISRDRRTP